MIWSPLGTPSTYLDTGSSRESLPSCASCRITVTVMVLVLLPIRKWSSTDNGASSPIVPVPNACAHVPWSGDSMCTTAPGMTWSFIACSIVDCSDDA